MPMPTSSPALPDTNLVGRQLIDEAVHPDYLQVRVQRLLWSYQEPKVRV